MAEWTNERHVELDPMRPVRGRHHSDSWVWHWLSLGLLVNRHVPEFIDDSVISEHLHHVWDTQCNDIPFLVE